MGQAEDWHVRVATLIHDNTKDLIEQRKALYRTQRIAERLALSAVLESMVLVVLVTYIWRAHA